MSEFYYTEQITGIAALTLAKFPLNCLQYGGFPRKVYAKNSRVIFLHKHLGVFLRWLILLVINKSKVGVFLYNSKWQELMMADVKIEADIVEKRLFAVKKKTTHYTFYVVNFPVDCSQSPIFS